MPTASRAVRKRRRLKRELSLAYKLVDVLSEQRNQARSFANFVAKELELKEKQIADLTALGGLKPDAPEGGLDSDTVSEVSPASGVDSLVQGPEEGVDGEANPVDGSNTNGDGLEVPQS